ncbi:hypothetical protein R1sor_006998 [Riccia sorocarpa]|uniref:Uncharacterized protein n=1 Tax=Riccia sorocarpa TaxID=122646 RepID=A0ABD3HP57_9MARC
MEILGLQLNIRTGTLLAAGISTILCLQFSLTLFLRHRLHWKNPAQQRQILIIICMAPLYAVTSFFGLVKARSGEAFFTFLESVKECYEALVIASFLNLMYLYLNVDTNSNTIPDEIKGRPIHHSFPITLFQPKEVKLDQKTLKLLQTWTWQFVYIRPALSILVGIVLAMLASAGVIRAEHKFLDLAQVEEAYQNLFVCLEMVVFGMFQMYAFSHEEYHPKAEQVDGKPAPVKGEEEKKKE